MEQPLNVEKPNRRIYRDQAIWLVSFLGGPLAVGYIIAENFKAFNEAGKARKTWVCTIIATIVIFGIIGLMPENTKIPKYTIPLMYTALAYALVQHFQKRKILRHIIAGGQLFSWWRAIVVGLIGLVVMLTAIIGYVFLPDKISMTTRTYGVMKHEIISEKGNITDAEANQLAAAFTSATFFDGVQTKYVHAIKVNNTYELSIGVVDGIMQHSDVIQSFIDLQADIQTLFPNNKIVLKLVVDNLDNVVQRIE